MRKEIGNHGQKNGGGFWKDSKAECRGIMDIRPREVVVESHETSSTKLAARKSITVT